MHFPRCQLCRVAPATCKSHIIPRQFYRRIRGSHKHLFELHVGKDIERRYTQSGIWQQGILCPKCDEKLGAYDKYAYEVLPEGLQQGRIKHMGPGASVYELGLIDADKFRKFLVALVWRASRSTHEMFRFTRIGSYEKRFESILTGKDISWLNRVDCVVIHLKPPRYDKVLIPPFHNVCEGVNIVQFYLYPWKLLIKLDGRPFGQTYANLALSAGPPTHALIMTFYSRGELRLLADFQRKAKAYVAARTGQKTKHL